MKKSLLFGSIICALACNTTLKGENGNLSLTFTHGGIFESVENPLAVGLLADVSIRDGSEGGVSVSQATSQDEELLLVESTDGNRLTLRSLAAGNASLTIETTSGITDVFSLSSAEIGMVRFEEPSTSLQSTVGVHPVAGAILWIPRTLEAESGQELTGYGLDAGEISPAGSGHWIEDGSIEHTLIGFDQPGVTSISHIGGNRKEFTVLSPADVSDWKIERVDNSGDTVSVGGGLFVTAFAEFADGRIGLTGLQSVDDDVCVSNSFLGSADTFYVEAVGPGVCQLFQGGNAEEIAITVDVIE
jgi:hypothetical protein